ncbi:hypothetical protein ACNA6I_23310 (plasmid) [Rossellomorea sp. FS2]|uniref:hypothetical protein n=1 Tax=Rossellomorea sp. FS2 TaxID=3391447 RepID=UPI003A4D1CE6
MKKIILIVISIFLLSIAFYISENKSKYDIGLIYTNSMEPKSELIRYDLENKSKEKLSIDAQGLTNVVKKENKILLTGNHGNIHVEVTNNKKIAQNDYDFPTNFFKEWENVKIFSLNKELEKNILVVKTKDEEKKKELEGFLRTGTIHNNQIYVFADLVHKKSSILYILDMEGEIKKQIELDYHFADDMLVIKDELAILTKEKITYLNTSTHKINYIKLPFEDPVHINLVDEKFLITSSDGVLGLFNEKFELINSIDTKRFIMKTRVKDNKIFILLPQIEAGQDNNIAQYSLSKDKIKFTKKYKIPDNTEELLVQDFYLE